MNKQHGFTLVEIALVAGVVLVVGAIAFTVVNANLKKPAQPINLVQSAVDEPDSNAINTQVKSDVHVAASAIAEYANNNAGQYPSSTDQVAAILSDSNSIKQPFMSPITKKVYVTGMVESAGEGVLSVMGGTCTANGTQVENPESPRQFVVVTKLKGAGLYCVNI